MKYKKGVDMSEKFLPLILVSALDTPSASKLISEIIDYEVTNSENKRPNGRVWHILNKYYSADVELCPAADGELPPLRADLLEAHIIYVTEEGAAEVPAAERRRAEVAESAAVSVRLLVTPGARVSGQLASWARRRGYESVALSEVCEPDPGPMPDAVGVQRLRDTLHAHTWRGLRRRDCTPREVAIEVDMFAESEEGPDSEGEDAVERAEAFAAALGSLEDARASPAATDDERRRHAERVVAAFCRALGADLPRL